LQLEVLRLSRKAFAQLNFDATACYDRIIPNLAMVVSRKFGVSKEVTILNASTLQQAKYHIRTVMGLSSSSYSHHEDMPIYGTGQGSRNSTMIWCFLSSLLFECYDKQAFPAVYTNPDRTNRQTWAMVGFVDESKGQVNNFDEQDTPASLSTLKEKARTNATAWANLLSASGGALELSKCSYHMLVWKFSRQGAPVLTNCEPALRNLPVQDPITGLEHSMGYLAPHSAHKTLGHYKEPAGTQKQQFEQLQRKSDKVTAFLWTTPLNREESWLFYNACYLPAITYPLTCSYF
jgi:hypothetical protein